MRLIVPTTIPAVAHVEATVTKSFGAVANAFIYILIPTFALVFGLINPNIYYG